MRDQKYKTTAMIADDLKRHQEILRAENILSVVGMVLAIVLAAAPLVYVLWVVS